MPKADPPKKICVYRPSVSRWNPLNVHPVVVVASSVTPPTEMESTFCIGRGKSARDEIRSFKTFLLALRDKRR